MHDDHDRYLVVKNHEDQYSIWPESREIPDGWTAVGEARSRQECLDYIEGAWTDMRPRSLREALSAKGEVADSSGS